MQGGRLTFVDASAYIALTDRSAGNYERARRIASRVSAEGWQVLTSNFILLEVHATLLSRLGRGIALRALQGIEASATTVLRITEADEQRAKAILVRYADKDFSLTDATSFAVRERRGIVQAFAFDRHFQQYGHAALTA